MWIQVRVEIRIREIGQQQRAIYQYQGFKRDQLSTLRIFAFFLVEDTFTIYMLLYA
jgi:hypothetical protein